MRLVTATLVPPARAREVLGKLGRDGLADRLLPLITRLEQLARQTELNLSTFEFVEHGGAAGAQNPYALARAQSPLDVNAQMEVRTRTRVPGGRGGTERGREPVLTTAPPRILPAGPTRSADGPGGV